MTDRSAQYDNQIRRWIKEDVVKMDIAEEDADMKEFARRLLKKCAPVSPMHASCDGSSPGGQPTGGQLVTAHVLAHSNAQGAYVCISCQRYPSIPRPFAFAFTQPMTSCWARWQAMHRTVQSHAHLQEEAACSAPYYFGFLCFLSFHDICAGWTSRTLSQ